MALLQTEFSKNDDPKVKSVINDQVSTVSCRMKTDEGG